MADRPPLDLTFNDGSCDDCGRRTARLPGMPVAVPDDFDWTARDYEGFRRVMLEDLAASDPERQRWTEADIELAIVEVCAAGLDRLSHALDTGFAEHFAQKALLPASLIAHLEMIDGIDAAWTAVRAHLVPEERKLYGFDGAAASQIDTLHAAMQARPLLMDVARVAGLQGLGTIQSFITLDDLRLFLESCPAIVQAAVRFSSRSGTGTYVATVLLAESEARLLDRVDAAADGGDAFLDFFRNEQDRGIPPQEAGGAGQVLSDAEILALSLRAALTRLIEPLLPIGTRLRLVDGKRVGIYLRLCVHVAPNYFRSEVEMAVRQLLSAGEGQFFDPFKWSFGEALVLSDLQEALMGLAGVEGVLINKLQIAGRPLDDATATGILRPRSDEALTLDPDVPGPRSGYLVLKMTGGQLG